MHFANNEKQHAFWIPKGPRGGVGSWMNAQPKSCRWESGSGERDGSLTERPGALVVQVFDPNQNFLPGWVGKQAAVAAVEDIRQADILVSPLVFDIPEQRIRPGFFGKTR